MARTVKEIMNRELLSVRSDDSSADVLNGLLALGISGSPVLDAEGRPTGMVSCAIWPDAPGPERRT